MKRPSTSSSSRSTTGLRLHVTMPVALALGALLLAVWFHPADTATPDSATYVEGARSLAEGQGYITWRGGAEETLPRNIATWPPGFSVLLAPGIAAGLEARESARGVLALCFVFLVVGSWFLSRRLAGAGAWREAAIAALCLGSLTPCLLGADAVLSDLPFAVCSTWALLAALATSMEAGADKRWRWVAVGALFGVTALFRWVGLYLGAASAVALLFAEPRSPLRPRLDAAVAFSMGFAGVLGSWLLRNIVTAGTPFGPRPPGDSSMGGVGEVIIEAAVGLGSPILSAIRAAPRSAFLWYGWQVLLLGACVGFVILWRAGRVWSSKELRLLVIVAVGYGSALIISAVATPVDPLTRGRFWIPLYPMIGAVLVFILARAPRVDGRHRLARAVIAISALCFLVLRGAGLIQHGSERLEERGWYRPAWRTTEVIDRAFDCPEGATLYSNEPRMLALWGGDRELRRLPTTLGTFKPVMRTPGGVCVFLVRSGTSRARGDYFEAWDAELGRLVGAGMIVIVHSHKLATNYRSPWLPP